MIKIKKFWLYFSISVFVCFILPAILTRRDVSTISKNSVDLKEENKVENQEESKNSEYQYQKYGTIKLLHKKSNDIEEIPIDTYLCNVVSAEMPVDYELEALKAQAVVARTYTVYKAQNPKHENADICDDSTCCQAWISKEERLEKWEEEKGESNWNKIETAVNETIGKIITYEGKPINAFFHSNSGGTTELPVNVWGGSNYPYLQIVETSGEEGYKQYSSEIVLSKNELIEKLKNKYQDIQIDFNNDDEIKITEYTDSNRVKTVKLGNHELSGVEARTIFGLKSTNFEIIKENENIIFSVKGYGHGVGMSQTGADTMAKQGSNYEDIIKHFYKDVDIKNINEI